MTFEENLYHSLPSDVCKNLLNSLKEEDKHAVLLNTKFITDEEFVKLYPNVKAHPFVKNAFIYNKDEYQLGKTVYHELGYFYLQEPSAMVVASLLDYKEDDFILDMCAAPGGKTIQAAIRLNGQGLIVSNDLSKSRAEIISNNIERLGLKNVVITNTNFGEQSSKFINTFDKIILDAPCSGSGMFRKDDKMIDDWSYNKVIKFAEIQKQLLIAGYKMLKPGGTLCYSTCSYSVEEDEEVISYLLENTDATLLDMPKIGFSNPNQSIGVRFLPCFFDGEGQYVCLVKKPGTLIKNKIVIENKYKRILPHYCDDKNIVQFGNTYFVSNYSLSLPKIPIIRYGVKVGEYLKNILHYDLHYARSLTKNEMDSIEIDENELKQYLLGNTLSHESNFKSYVLLTYKNNPVDIAKTDGFVIKNHYPKGLRKKFN